jgi:NADH-quinone oxidoreductase subunit N
MALCLISLAGLPPTAGFFAKLYIFGAAIASGNLFLALLGILTSLIGLYYYLRIVVAMYMRPSAEPAAAPAMVTAPGKLSLAIAAIGTLALTVFAGTSINLAERTVATLFNLTT